ncbi:alkaline phosphatase family protein [Sphingobacterium sp. UT-1RO-CII-1]|uniref:alkaline phosphatase family protein n=1 Tax=Sphingobacterium sp. UT-1RO-CII-1 TaxID=2995225 RepID=UPI00227C7354|nr:alkaline phosphatase family protein [Sphingobacterium sp. UT-1RO-CII-1]MCY4780268.1 alkaline phosphatase family protein [Sphingobacterium sp. UT-1RO-CII-1]
MIKVEIKKIVKLSLLYIVFCFGLQPAVAQKTKQLVLISLDGVSVDGVERANAPVIDSLMKAGAFSLDTRVVMPSITLPNWTSMLTGSGPEQHGVVDNGWKIDKYVLPPAEKDEDGYYPSVFSVLKKQMPHVRTAFYYNWGDLINTYNKKYLDETSFLENDGYKENYHKAFNFIKDNKKNSFLIFLYSGHTDNAGHKHQWKTDGYLKSIEEADKVIGEFLGALKKEGLDKNIHFMFLSDHGGIGYGHGGVTVDEMLVPWSISGPRVRAGYKIEEPNNTINTGAVILKLFNAKAPRAWIGRVPQGVFK